MGTTNIQWTASCDGTAGFTFNAWMGCRKVAPECKNCYIVRQTPLRVRNIEHGSQRVRTAESTWKQPLAWNRMAEKQGTRPRVFCLSLGDWLDDEVPIEWLADLLNLICITPNLDWLLLTKRPQNWAKRMEQILIFLSGPGLSIDEAMLRTFVSNWLEGWEGVTYTAASRGENIWIGVSAGADQAAALAIPARIHFLSCEPMLHPMDTTHAAGFDWIIFGGESGKHARPTDIQWIRDGVKFCRANGVAPFVKQMGANLIHERYPRAEREFNNFGRVENFEFKDSHGGDMSEWPEDLRVREFPKRAKAGVR
jgi:protein gp37